MYLITIHSKIDARRGLSQKQFNEFLSNDNINFKYKSSNKDITLTLKISKHKF